MTMPSPDSLTQPISRQCHWRPATLGAALLLAAATLIAPAPTATATTIDAECLAASP